MKGTGRWLSVDKNTAHVVWQWPTVWLSPGRWIDAGWRAGYGQRWMWCLCWLGPLSSSPHKRQWCNQPDFLEPLADAFYTVRCIVWGEFKVHCLLWHFPTATIVLMFVFQCLKYRCITSWASSRWVWSEMVAGGSVGERMWCDGPDADQHRRPVCLGSTRGGRNERAELQAAGCSARGSYVDYSVHKQGWPQPGWSSGHWGRSWCLPDKTMTFKKGYIYCFNKDLSQNDFCHYEEYKESTF